MITLEDVVEYLEIRRFAYSVVEADSDLPLDIRYEAYMGVTAYEDIIEFLKKDSKKVKLIVEVKEKENK